MLAKKTLDTGISFHWDPIGEHGGESLAGTFERKRQYILVLFFDPEDIKILSLEVIWDLVKGQGSPELMSDYGAQRTRL
jgi:hypothetical protein